MNKLFRRVKAAIGMGLTWAFGWALVGFGIELVHNVWPNPLGSMVDIWPAALAYPAFFSGVVFSGVLGIAARHRRFDELSIARFAWCGAFGGLLLGVLPAALATAGGITATEAVVATSILTVLGAVSASGSLLLARSSETTELVEASSPGGRLTDLRAGPP